MMRKTSCVLLALVTSIPLVACKSDPQATAREHLEKGDTQLTRKRYPEAIIEYRRAVQADPRLGRARLQLAFAYASTGDGGNALREYARAAELLPDDDDAQAQAGSFMLMAGRFQDAEALAARMLQRDPNSVQGHILRANALSGLKDLDGAIAEFEKALSLDPNRATTYAELGSVQLASGNRDAADKAFRKAIEIDPKSAKAHLAFAHFLWNTGSLPEGEKEMRTALELDPQLVIAHRAMAMYLIMTRRAAEAEPHLKAVAEHTPTADGEFVLAEYYVRLNRHAEARAVLTPLLQDKDAFVGASLRLARLDAIAGKYADAHRIIDAVLAREANNVEALVTRGKLFLAENNSVNALSTLQTAVNSHPQSIEANLALAQTYSIRGQVKEATTAYNDALKIDGNNIEGRL